MQSRHERVLSAVLVFAAVSACAPHKIPGTDIDDTSDTRAVLEVVNAYRQAVERRDASAVAALADESFRDDGGSASPEDDLDFERLKTVLPARLQKLHDLRLDLTVKRVEFDDEQHVVRVTYSYQVTFKMPDYTSRPQSETDIKQMTLKYVDKGWKITSGI